MAKPKSLLYGLNPLHTLLCNKPASVIALWMDRGKKTPRHLSIQALAKKHQLRIQFVPTSTLDKLSQGGEHQGVLAHIESIEQDQLSLKAALSQGSLTKVLFVDRVQDPRNLGACIRSALGASFDAVIVPTHQSAGITSAVHKASAGASLLMPIFCVKSTQQSLVLLREHHFSIVGLSMQGGDPLHQCSWQKPLALVVGSEHKGLRPIVAKACTHHCYIPMHKELESLNLAVAASLCMYETLRDV